MPISPLPAAMPATKPLAARPGINPQTKPDESRAGSHGFKLMLALLVVALGLFGVFAYNLWFAEDPAPVVASRPEPKPAPTEVAAEPAPAKAAPAQPVDQAPARPAPPPAAKPAQPTVVADAPQSLPGKLVAQARDAAAAHDAALTAPVNEVLATPSAPTAPAPTPGAAEPAAETPPAAPPEPAVAPAELPRPEPSPTFKAYVVNLKINGVFQGENARAMLNGKMYRLGEIVDEKLGIVFLRLEPENKRIVFEDAKGAIMSRRY
jgi:hypothetical protein